MCGLYTSQCAVCNVQCAMCSVQCTVCVEVDRLKLSSLEIQEILLPLTLVLTWIKGKH